HIPITGRPAGLVTGKTRDDTSHGGPSGSGEVPGRQGFILHHATEDRDGDGVRARSLPVSQRWRTAPRPSTWVWALGEQHRQRMISGRLSFPTRERSRLLRVTGGSARRVEEARKGRGRLGVASAPRLAVGGEAVPRCFQSFATDELGGRRNRVHFRAVG